jgi:hypothetical protein
MSNAKKPSNAPSARVTNDLLTGVGEQFISQQYYDGNLELDTSTSARRNSPGESGIYFQRGQVVSCSDELLLAADRI